MKKDDTDILIFACLIFLLVFITIVAFTTVNKKVYRDECIQSHVEVKQITSCYRECTMAFGFETDWCAGETTKCKFNYTNQTICDKYALVRDAK